MSFWNNLVMVRGRWWRRFRAPTSAPASAAVVAVLLTATLVAGCTIGPVGQGPASSSSVAPSPPLQANDGAIRYPYPVPAADPAQNYGMLYLPGGDRAPRSVPLVVLIHGGGWQTKATARYMGDVARALQRAGLAVWNIEYRRVGSGGGWPTTFTDVGAAVDFVPDLAARAPVIDPSNVIFVGHSAGGQLAAWAAARGTLPPAAPGASPRVIPRAFVSLAGVLDMRVSSRLNTHVGSLLRGTPAQVPERFALVNPIQRINPQVPGVAIHGTKDTVVPYSESVDFVAAATAIAAPALLVTLVGANHGAPVNTRSAAWPEVQDTIVRLATRGFADLLASPPR